MPAEIDERITEFGCESDIVHGHPRGQVNLVERKAKAGKPIVESAAGERGDRDNRPTDAAAVAGDMADILQPKEPGANAKPQIDGSRSNHEHDVLRWCVDRGCIEIEKIQDQLECPQGAYADDTDDHIRPSCPAQKVVGPHESAQPPLLEQIARARIHQLPPHQRDKR